MELTPEQFREINLRRGAQDGIDLIEALARDGSVSVLEAGDDADVFAAPEDSVDEPDATAAAESLAAEEGVDLSSVEGSGQDGRVLVSDVEAAAEAAE